MALNKKNIITADLTQKGGVGSSADDNVILNGFVDQPQSMVAEACTTGANIDPLSVPATIDAETPLTGKNYLLKDQTDAKTNGLYTFDGTNLVRNVYFDHLVAKDYVIGVKVVAGTANADKTFKITSNSPTVGTDNIIIVDEQSSVTTDASYTSTKFVSGAILADRDVVVLDVSNQLQKPQATTTKSSSEFVGMTVESATGSGEQTLTATTGIVVGVTDFAGNPLVKDATYCISTTAGKIAKHDDAQFTTGIWKRVFGTAISTTAIKLASIQITEQV